MISNLSLKRKRKILHDMTFSFHSIFISRFKLYRYNRDTIVKIINNICISKFVIQSLNNVIFRVYSKLDYQQKSKNEIIIYNLIEFSEKAVKILVSASFDDSALTELASSGCNNSLTSPTFAIYPTIQRGTPENIVKTALKYYTVSHRKNCCAVDGNLPLSPCASDDSYCSHEENTSAVTLNSRAGGTPSMNTANYPDISSLHIGAPH